MFFTSLVFCTGLKIGQNDLPGYGKSFCMRSTTSLGSVIGALFKYLPKKTK